MTAAGLTKGQTGVTGSAVLKGQDLRRVLPWQPATYWILVSLGLKRQIRILFVFNLEL